MYINALKIEKNSAFHCSVCIIGAGVAGISIAIELMKRGVDVFILESGGKVPDNETRDLYRGENVGIPYSFSDGCRGRYIGGTSNYWGGWCAPMDEHDFEHRAWVNESGWPISKKELTPFYQKSHEILKLGPYDYNPAYWVNAINHPEVERIVTNQDKVIDKISQFSPPAKMGLLYKNELEQKNIRVFLYANVVNICCNENGNSITSVEVKTLKGNGFYIFASQFILATGGIENSRLLLLSDTVHKKGLGNDYDLLGRYFMDHPRMVCGKVVLTKRWVRNRLYDVRYHYHSPVVSAFNTSIAAQFALTRKVQEKEGLLNARTSLASIFYGETSKAAHALRNLNKACSKKGTEGFSTKQELFRVLGDPVNSITYSIAKYFKPRFLLKQVGFQIIIEQEPSPNSRITLSNEKDSLGMRRVKVNWQMGEKEKNTIDRNLEIISQQLQQSGVAEKIILDEPLKNRDWPAETQGTWHHMGTTRMHTSPRKGVVDENCKVHGIENLYVAGSSVFPTCGANFPTITLTALALRLSDYLTLKLNSEKKSTAISSNL
ncbi:MAG: GMC family oxidoreductase [Bacteroidetes bacterium]|nr:GMC family oxidoreductase [Bacteroidota bacterium]